MIRRWWFADAVAACAAAAPLVVAALLTPGGEAVSLLGWEVPPLCQWRLLFGVSCPGCGLTRSFVFLAHAQVLEAFRMNWLGPPAFLGLAAVSLRSVWRLARGVGQPRP